MSEYGETAAAAGGGLDATQFLFAVRERVRGDGVEFDANGDEFLFAVRERVRGDPVPDKPGYIYRGEFLFAVRERVRGDLGCESCTRFIYEFLFAVRERVRGDSPNLIGAMSIP